MWKLVSTMTGMLAALLAKKLLRTTYRAIRKDVVSARLAAIGWEAATGTLPPRATEESAVS